MGRFISGRRNRRAAIVSRWGLYAAATFLATLVAAHARAQQADDGQTGPVATLAADVKDYVTAPLHARRPQWVRFGAALGAVAVAHAYDDDVREHFGTVAVAPGTSPATRDGRDAAPAVLALGGTWLAAALSDNDDGRREAGLMFEAAALSGAAGYALKQIARRERPYTTADDGAWREDGDSFPSLHTATAFAIGTVLAESGNDRHRWLRRVLGYGLAVGTAYSRMDHDAHWLSDTVAGAGLGVATARFVMRQRGRDEGRARLALVPAAGGVAVGYQVDLRP